MHLSSKGRYAVMAMADLAARASARPVPLAMIAAAQGISLDYLEQLFLKLRRAGLVKAARGPGGGYLLNRQPEHITIGEIMSAVDEPVKMIRCYGDPAAGCLGNKRCLTHDLWRALGDHIIVFLQSVTLRDVVDGGLRLPDLSGAAEFEQSGGARPSMMAVE